MRGKVKKWAAAFGVAFLCVGAAGMAAPMQTYAAETDGVVVVETTQRCSIWSAPATTEENRVKYVDAGYQIQVYPQPIASELADGKTFYRTIKGAYVLCRCVEGAGVGTENEAQNETPSAPEDNGVLVPVGDVPRVKQTGDYTGWETYSTDYEEWVSWVDSDGTECSVGINILNAAQDAPTTDSYGITHRGYYTELAIDFVAQAAAGDAEIAQFLTAYGKRILICNSNYIFVSTAPGSMMSRGLIGPTWTYGAVECQRGECLCIIISFSPDGVTEITDCLRNAMQNSYWQEALRN